MKKFMLASLFALSSAVALAQLDPMSIVEGQQKGQRAHEKQQAAQRAQEAHDQGMSDGLGQLRQQQSTTQGSAADAQTMNVGGIRLGDNIASVVKLKLPLISSEKRGIVEIRKYQSQDGNEVSFTGKSGKIVYIEVDWSQNPNASRAPFGSMVFGATSLRDIRSHFGSNGFTHKNRASTLVGNTLVLFNCFELVAARPTVLVVVTKVVASPGINADNLAEHLLLDSLILADPGYLDAIWGSAKLFDPIGKQSEQSPIDSDWVEIGRTSNATVNMKKSSFQRRGQGTSESTACMLGQMVFEKGSLLNQYCVYERDCILGYGKMYIQEVDFRPSSVSEFALGAKGGSSGVAGFLCSAMRSGN